jgi:hypothetical protein
MIGSGMYKLYQWEPQTEGERTFQVLPYGGRRVVSDPFGYGCMHKTVVTFTGKDIGLAMAIFVLEHVGAIQTGPLPSGDMKVWHPRNEKLRAIVEGACRGRGYWNSEYNNWIVKARFTDTALSEIAAQTQRIA